MAGKPGTACLRANSDRERPPSRGRVLDAQPLEYNGDVQGGLMPGQIKSLTRAALLIVIAFLSSAVSWQGHKPLTRKPAATRSGSSAEAVWSLEPVANTYISTWARDTNYGSATALRIYQNYCKVLLRFDPTTVPAVSTITSAKLFVTFQSVDSSAPTEPKKYFVYDQATEFVESEATWVQAARGVSWAADGMSDSKDFNALPYRSQPIVANDPGEYSVDLTDLAKALRASGKNAMSVTLFATEFNNRGYIYSRAHSDPPERPRLEIQWSRTMPQAKTQDVFAVTGPINVDGRNSILPDGTNTGLTYLWTIDKPAYGSSYPPASHWPTLRFSRSTLKRRAFTCCVCESRTRQPASSATPPPGWLWV